ncbi:SDR family oxidoreductase [Arvimicrobium flavum]|uniref:SDR family oxidoreductase n=1 Tax=Arvimicrobium flavum TaxID=3393320 RepID=UPI00237AE616|nr:SDR family oxidoreductase [Mesorhizobium shangrilense]
MLNRRHDDQQADFELVDIPLFKPGLRDKSVLILGGGSGIGFATARIAHALGANVLVAGRTREALERASIEIGGCDFAVADVTRSEDLQAVFESRQKFDHILLAAGTHLFGKLAELTRAEISVLVEERLWAPINIGKLAAKHMTEGSITFLSGGLGSRPVPGAALKHAVLCATEGLTRGLALDLAPIRVNAVAPGYTRTPLFESLLGPDPSSKMKQMAATIPVKRLGDAMDAAYAAIHLMTNGFMSGEVMHVDGGGRFVPPSLAFVDNTK